MTAAPTIACPRCSVPVPARDVGCTDRCVDAHCPLKPPAGHVVAMTTGGDRFQSIATCQCGGFVSRVPWAVGCHIEQDLAIAQHWLAVNLSKDAAA